MIRTYKLDANQPIVFDDGTMQYQFRDFILRVEQAIDGAALTSSWGSISGDITQQADLIALIDSVSVNVTWGDISGNLSDQADLQSALDDKVGEAPINGQQYARQNGSWSLITGGGGGGSSVELFQSQDIQAYAVDNEYADILGCWDTGTLVGSGFSWSADDGVLTITSASSAVEFDVAVYAESDTEESQAFSLALLEDSGSGFEVVQESVATATTIAGQLILSNRINGFKRFSVEPNTKYKAQLFASNAQVEEPGVDPFWENRVLLLGVDDQPAGSTTFPDESPAGTVVTPVGGVVVSQPGIVGDSSVEFNGSNSGLDVPWAAIAGGEDQQLTTSFEFEAYVSLSPNSTIFSTRIDAPDGINSYGITCRLQNDNRIRLFGYVGSGGTTGVDFTSPDPVSGRTYIRVFFDGVDTWGIQVGANAPVTGVASLPIVHWQGEAFTIGKNYNNSVVAAGSMDEIRIGVGLTIDQSSSVVPELPFPRQGPTPEPEVDPFWDNVSALIRAEGGQVVDVSDNANALTLTGISVNTTDTFFGSQDAIQFTGTNASIVTPNDPAFQLGTGDFTIEWRNRYQTGANPANLDTGGTTNADRLVVSDSTAAAAILSRLTVNGGTPTDAAGVSAGDEVYWAIKREAGVTSFWKNGVILDSSFADTNNYTRDIFCIGNAFSNRTVAWQGQWTEIRITKGVARDVSFVPTAPFPVGGSEPSNLWTPAEIATELWLDGSDAGTIVESGGSVSEWQDKSGNSRNVSQTTGSKQPVYNAAASQIEFLPDQTLDNSLPFVYDLNGAYIFMLAELVNSSEVSGGVFLSEVSSSSPTPIYSFYRFSGTDDLSTFIRNDADSIRLNVTYSGEGAAGLSIFSQLDTGDEIRYSRDAATPTVNGYSRSGALSTDTFAINALPRGGSPNNGATINIKKIVVTPPLSDADRERMEGWLAWEGGIASNLPAGHPYKNAAPTVEPSNLWTPAELTTELWLDAEDASTITENAGLVEEWRDKSGNGYDYAASGAERPSQAFTNGTNGFVFNGSSNRLTASGSSPQATQDADFFVVFNRPASGTLMQPLGSASTTDGYPFYWYSENNIYVAYGINGSTGRFTSSPLTLAGDFVGSSSSSSADKELYLNGVQVTLGSTLVATTSQSLDAIGFRGNGEYTLGTIKEIVLFPARLPQAERELMEGYLAWKHGLQANLPAGHPYENAAPTIDVPPPPPPGPTIISNINVGTAAVAGQTYISAKRYS